MTREAIDSGSDDGIPPAGWARRRNVILAMILTITLALGALFAWGLRRDPSLIRSPLVGKRAPSFVLPTLDGNRTVHLSNLHGQVVVLNFWASWCTACRQEHPNFVQAWTRYQDQGVTFVGVLYQDSAAAARAYMRDLGGTWPNVVDPGNRTALHYGVYGVPETFFIGRTGIIEYKQIGYTSYDLLSSEIDRLLGKDVTG